MGSMSKNEGNQKLKFFKPSDLAWNVPEICISKGASIKNVKSR